MSYYLAKPFDDEALINLTHTALRDSKRYNALVRSMMHRQADATPVTGGNFTYRTHQQAQALAASLAVGAERPADAVVGLYELMSNGIEHGNLALSYQDKETLLNQGFWQEELDKRLALPSNLQKEVAVTVMPVEVGRCVTIHDQGEGFAWQEYLSMSPTRGQDNHGRGIAVCKLLCRLPIEYTAPGNQVSVVI